MVLETRRDLRLPTETRGGARSINSIDDRIEANVSLTLSSPPWPGIANVPVLTSPPNLLWAFS